MAGDPLDAHLAAVPPVAADLARSIARASQPPHGTTVESWSPYVAQLQTPAAIVDAMAGARRALDEAYGGDAEVHRRVAAAADEALRLMVDEATSKLAEQALHDPLTHLGNRRAFNEALVRAAAAARRGRTTTVVSIDLDGLKTINDTDGHAAGDAALSGLADAMRSALRETDQAFRVGGDEFVVLLDDATPEVAAVVMGRVEAMGAPKFSWGAALAGIDPEADLAAADRLLYAGRKARRKPVRHRTGPIVPMAVSVSLVTMGVAGLAAGGWAAAHRQPEVSLVPIQAEPNRSPQPTAPTASRPVAQAPSAPVATGPSSYVPVVAATPAPSEAAAPPASAGENPVGPPATTTTTVATPTPAQAPVPAPAPPATSPTTTTSVPPTTAPPAPAPTPVTSTSSGTPASKQTNGRHVAAHGQGVGRAADLAIAAVNGAGGSSSANGGGGKGQGKG